MTIDDTADDLFDSIRRYMVAIDSQVVPDDFPLKNFAEMMGEYGTVDAEMYKEVRAMAEKAAEERRKELAAEEKRREQEAEKAEMAEKAPAEKSGCREKSCGRESCCSQAEL